jgi:hypothetical protein
MIFDPLDVWFEKGFRIRKQRPATAKGDKIRSGSGQRSVPVGGTKFSPGAKADNARAVIKRAPKVVVKIMGEQFRDGHGHQPLLAGAVRENV